LKDWLTARDEAFRDRIKVVTMAGFSGYRTATAETLDKARTVMDPFHVMHLAAEQLDPVSQRVEQRTCGYWGRSGDLLYGIPRPASGCSPTSTRPASPPDFRRKSRFVAACQPLCQFESAAAFD